MVIMASGIACGHIHTETMAAELPNIAAIPKKKRHAALVYCVLLLYWTSIL